MCEHTHLHVIWKLFRSRIIGHKELSVLNNMKGPSFYYLISNSITNIRQNHKRTTENRKGIELGRKMVLWRLSWLMNPSTLSSAAWGLLRELRGGALTNRSGGANESLRKTTGVVRTWEGQKQNEEMKQIGWVVFCLLTRENSQRETNGQENKDPRPKLSQFSWQ